MRRYRRAASRPEAGPLSRSDPGGTDLPGAEEERHRPHTLPPPRSRARADASLAADSAAPGGARSRSAGLTIPGLVKRNTLLFAATQALVGTGTQMMPTLGPLMAVDLTGTTALAGLATAVTNGSKVAVAYPIGYVTDRFGRKAGVLIGLALALVGVLVLGLATARSAFPLFLIGIVVFGLGVGAVQQLRLAAADMYPPTRRAEGVGYVLSGALLGAMGGPLLVSTAMNLAPDLHLSGTAIAWWLVPVVILPSMALVFLVRPDPREIAAHLSTYYPGYAAPPPRSATTPAPATGFRAFVAHYPKRVAFIASFSVQGNMNMMMAMTAVALDHHGHTLTAISLAVALHVIGMYGFSLPLGHLADRFGRRAVLLLGMGVQLVGALLVALTGEYWSLTAGTALVGLGWSCVNVAASALIADTTAPHERGRAVGTNDTFSSVAPMILPLLGGLLVAVAGLPVLAVVSAVVLSVPTYLLLRLVEPRPGRYLDSPAKLWG